MNMFETLWHNAAQIASQLNRTRFEHRCCSASGRVVFRKMFAIGGERTDPSRAAGRILGINR
jgi:hypothetical protein